jgi:hypothetical protein
MSGRPRIPGWFWPGFSSELAPVGAASRLPKKKKRSAEELCRPHFRFSLALTVIYDVSCNLCNGGNKELLCLTDNTTETCDGDEGDCNDCYLRIGEGCGEGGIRCAPKVHLAWIGTDANGHNLLSSGSILSSFSAYALGPVISDSYDGIRGSLDGDED